MIVLLASALLSVAPIAMIDASGALLCTAFLAAAMLRLLTGWFGGKPAPDTLIDDSELPIYTVMCALRHEAAMVKQLAAAIRALDYPGIMAQTPGVCTIIRIIHRRNWT